MPMTQSEPGKQVSTYIAPSRREDWKQEAESRDMSLSNWVDAMVEAGRKKFERDVEPDESKRELRKRLSERRERIKRKNEEIARLESELDETEREVILDFVEENPGVEYIEIVRHVKESANGRITRLLDRMDGSEIEFDDEGRVYRR